MCIYLFIITIFIIVITIFITVLYTYICTHKNIYIYFLKPRCALGHQIFIQSEEETWSFRS